MHTKKIIIPVFKTKSSGTCFVFGPDYGFSTCQQKPRFESLHLLLKAPTTESMVVILSVMCIVPKEHCLLHGCDIIYSEVIVSSRHLNLGGAPAFMFCFTKGGKRDITCHIYLPCSLQICLMLQFHVEKLLVL